MHTSIRQILTNVMVGGVLLIGVVFLPAIWFLSNGLIERHQQHTFQIAKDQFHKIIQQSAETLHQQSIELLRQPSFRKALESKNFQNLADAAQRFSDRKGTRFSVSSTELLMPLTYHVEKYQDQVFLTVSIKVNDAVTVTAREPITKGYFNTLITEHKVGVIFQYQSNGAILFSSNHLSDISLQSIRNINPIRLWLSNFLNSEKVFVSTPFAFYSVPHPEVAIYLIGEFTGYYEMVNKLQKVLLGLIILLLLLALLLAWQVSRRVNIPLRRLVKHADELAQGNYIELEPTPNSLSEIKNLYSALSVLKNSVKRREEQILYQATHDLVTGLYNRNFLEQTISRSIEAERRLQLIGIKVLGIRRISELYGYASGDKCLQMLAQRLLRWPGTVTRISDDELVFIPEHALSEEQIDTLKHIAEQPVEIEYFSIPVKVALITLNCPQQVENVADMFKKIRITIDEAITSKQRVMAFDDKLEVRYARRLSIVLELKNALVNCPHELAVVYQPIINLETNALTSVEALIRWNSKKLGVVSPDEFIKVAEQAGIIDKVTDWVIQRVLIELYEFRQLGYSFPIAINLSSHDIQRESFIKSFTPLLKEVGFSPADIELDLTESDLLSDLNAAKRNLTALHKSGFSLAIDDFGTGYSSLAYIKDFTFTTLKIDKRFIITLDKNESDKLIVKTILLLAKALRLAVTAEGVENEESLALLKEWGCTHAQGYFLSKPLSAEELVKQCRDGKFNVTSKPKLNS
ncbi:putative bifunctional diguanylate cyclase/phosphodiesterase [Alteromonas sp. ASW11-130]|uniref:putative bifunctional diguanylate cyclase/phosphodiesterase n=1 Tax=Alteromonas sp. ASW11-130 TaxID=3015775 RepID=UPI002241A273|nr:bifunctional diguanylate cyclase/phosphodiesterase [Alteromonas sp. ASW11-130]MCW8092115.1 bifunctional diguanylate cyclase/phosphodiesterase [Alteromonas sp. ASW11-130]